MTRPPACPAGGAALNLDRASALGILALVHDAIMVRDMEGRTCSGTSPRSSITARPARKPSAAPVGRAALRPSGRRRRWSSTFSFKGRGRASLGAGPPHDRRQSDAVAAGVREPRPQCDPGDGSHSRAATVDRCSRRKKASGSASRPPRPALRRRSGRACSRRSSAPISPGWARACRSPARSWTRAGDDRGRARGTARARCSWSRFRCRVWLNLKSWEGFAEPYQSQGYNVTAPDWPFKNRDPIELRRSPRPELARIGRREIIDRYDRVDPRTGEAADPDRAVRWAEWPSSRPGVPLGRQALWSALPMFINSLSWRKVKTMPAAMKIRWYNSAKPSLLLIAGEIEDLGCTTRALARTPDPDGRHPTGRRALRACARVPSSR